MGNCRLCGRNLGTSDSCIPDRWAHGKPAIPYGSETRLKRDLLDRGLALKPRCHDCGVVLGGFHHAFCDVEECPICFGQALVCACSTLAETGTPALAARWGSTFDDYSMADVRLLTGAKRSQIENWVRSGWLTPKSAESGTGHHRTFSFRNLVDVAIGARLSQFHLPLATMFRRSEGEGFRDLVPDPWRWLKKSDEQLGRVMTRGWSAKTWTAWLASGQSKAVVLTQSGARWRGLLEQQRLYMNPETRPAEGAFLLAISADRGRFWWDWYERELASLPEVAVVINLRALLEGLERETGERWGDG